MRSGTLALLLGVMAGFLALGTLYFWFVQRDLSLVAMCAALAGSQVAVLSAVLRRRPGSCAKG